MGSMAIINGVVALLQEIEQKIARDELRLSVKEWVGLDRRLEDVRLLLAMESPSINELDDVAWLLIAAFESNQTLARQFADRLAMLTRGTKLTGRVPHQTNNNTRLVKNRMTVLTFAQKVKQQAQNSRQSGQSQQSGRTGQTGQRS